MITAVTSECGQYEIIIAYLFKKVLCVFSVFAGCCFCQGDWTEFVGLYVSFLQVLSTTNDL